MNARRIYQTPAAIMAAKFNLEEIPEATELVTLDAISSAASYLRRNWGDDGYKLGIVRGIRGHGLFMATHTDGSRFYFIVDRYGNCADVNS